MTSHLDWKLEGKNWPHAEASFFPEAAGHRWHVQRMGKGPLLALVHGTGAASHSWSGLMPLLATRFDVIAFDLPGHGFSSSVPGRLMSLPNIAADISALFDTLDVQPTIIAGHSAGAAIIVRAIADGYLRSEAAISINGAFSPFSGPAGLLFPLAAKALYYNPLTPYFFQHRAQRKGRVKRLIEQTGSYLSEDQLRCYEVVMQSRSHIRSALGMMAHWDLSSMKENLSQLEIPFLLIAGARDQAVPPADSKMAAQLATGSKYAQIENAGHLAHEETPSGVASLVFDYGVETQILPG